MAYMLLVIEEPEMRRRRPTAEGRQLYDRMLRFGDGLKARGLLRLSESLRSDVDGVRVSLRGGKRKLVDGPFAESKEMVGGFFLLDCETKEEAVAIAGECPALEWATIEVREVAPCYEG